MVRLPVLAKKLTILFMKANSKTIYTMAMVGSFTQMATITSAIGLMGSGQGTGSWWTNLEGFMKGSGSTVSLWVNDQNQAKSFFNEGIELNYYDNDLQASLDEC